MHYHWQSIVRRTPPPSPSLNATQKHRHTEAYNRCYIVCKRERNKNKDGYELQRYKVKKNERAIVIDIWRQMNCNDNENNIIVLIQYVESIPRARYSIHIHTHTHRTCVRWSLKSIFIINLIRYSEELINAIELDFIIFLIEWHIIGMIQFHGCPEPELCFINFPFFFFISLICTRNMSTAFYWIFSGFFWKTKSSGRLWVRLKSSNELCHFCSFFSVLVH